MASSSDRKGSIPPGYQDISQFSAYLDQCSKEVLNFIKVETDITNGFYIASIGVEINFKVLYV